MQQFTGTKTILAAPMTRGDYNHYRGWTIPADEDPEEVGYLVEYTDGGKPNHPDHAGYISWSPANVFERAYHPSGTFIERMEAELTDLSSRTDKAVQFTRSEKFATFTPGEQALLDAQIGAMIAYAKVLQIRLNVAKMQEEGGI